MRAKLVVRCLVGLHAGLAKFDLYFYKNRSGVVHPTLWYGAGCLFRGTRRFVLHAPPCLAVGFGLAWLVVASARRGTRRSAKFRATDGVAS